MWTCPSPVSADVLPGNNEKRPYPVTSAIRELATGRSNAVGTVALRASSTTMVKAPNCSALSVPFLTALTANALAANPYIQSVGEGAVYGRPSEPS